MAGGVSAEQVMNLVRSHPAVNDVHLVGSHAEGRATARSDWDFRVETSDFDSVASSLPDLCHALHPLVQQWDRLSDHPCYMLIVRGPVKVDLIFSSESREHESPWVPSSENLGQIDAHFWDWMLWLRSKERPGNEQFVATELVKLSQHLLSPLGVHPTPGSIQEAITRYRAARADMERRFDVAVPRALDRQVSRAVLT